MYVTARWVQVSSSGGAPEDAASEQHTAASVAPPPAGALLRSRLLIGGRGEANPCEAVECDRCAGRKVRLDRPAGQGLTGNEGLTVVLKGCVCALTIGILKPAIYRDTIGRIGCRGAGVQGADGLALAVVEAGAAARSESFEAGAARH